MLKGHLDMIVLAALSAGPAHGYAVIEEIRRRSGQAFDLPEGTIYPALHRLEQAGLLSSRWVVAEFGTTAPHIRADPTRRTRADRTSGGLAEVFRGDWRAACRRPATRERSVISEYLDALQAALHFDRSLARRVCSEFEDHLREALAADPSDNRWEAERRAIAKCGEPRAIAAELSVISLAKRTKKLAIAVVLVLLGVLLAMKGHIAWYAAMQWLIKDDMKPLATTIGAIARNAFWIATFVGAAGWVYGSMHRLPSDYFYGRYSRHLYRILPHLRCGVGRAPGFRNQRRGVSDNSNGFDNPVCRVFHSNFVDRVRTGRCWGADHVNPRPGPTSDVHSGFAENLDATISPSRRNRHIRATHGLSAGTARAAASPCRSPIAELGRSARRSRKIRSARRRSSIGDWSPD